jgi:RNA polymerase sigma-70 factor (ECF subfamily)
MTDAGGRSSTPEALAKLARGAARGDRQAANALCMRLKDPVFGYCMRRLRRRADAEDVCQEVLVSVLSGLPRLAKPEAVMGYAVGIARNMVNRHLTRGPQRREVSMGNRLAFEAAPGPLPGTPDPRDLRARRMRALEELLAEALPEVQDLVRRYYFSGQTSADIAETLGMKAAGVRMKIKRIRERLHREMLRRALGDPS